MLPVPIGTLRTDTDRAEAREEDGGGHDETGDDPMVP